MDTCIHMAESLCYSPETITTLLISCTPIQNLKFLKKKICIVEVRKYLSSIIFGMLNYTESIITGAKNLPKNTL